MLRFIPMLIAMGIFAAIGIYWTFLTRHFLEWTRKYNQSFQQPVDGRTPQPVLVSAEVESDHLHVSGTKFLTWGIRMIGGTIAAFALIMIGMMFFVGI